jgi:hypothetical protein
MFSLFLDYNLGILGNPGLSPTQPNENPNPFLATRPKPKPAWVGLIPPRTRPDPTQTTAYGEHTQALYILLIEYMFKSDQMVQWFAHVLTTGKHLRAMFDRV